MPWVLEAEATRHNIVFILVDDLPAHVEPYLDDSHPLKRANVNFTPNIKRLAEESVTFRRAYVQNTA